MGFPGVSDSKESACNVGDLGSVPGLVQSPGEGNGNSRQYSCLENPMNGGARWAAVLAKLLQVYPTLCDPMDCSPPGSSVHGILQARILEWVAISFSVLSIPVSPFLLSLLPTLLGHRRALS